MCLCVQIGRLLQPVRRVCGYPARCLVLVRRRASRRLLQTCEWSRQRHHPPWPLREPCRSGGMAASPMATARSHTATPACSSHVQCSSDRAVDEKQQPAAGEGKGTVGGCPGMLCCSWKMSSVLFMQGSSMHARNVALLSLQARTMRLCCGPLAMHTKLCTNHQCNWVWHWHCGCTTAASVVAQLAASAVSALLLLLMCCSCFYLSAGFEPPVAAKHADGKQNPTAKN